MRETHLSRCCKDIFAWPLTICVPCFHQIFIKDTWGAMISWCMLIDLQIFLKFVIARRTIKVPIIIAFYSGRRPPFKFEFDCFRMILLLVVVGREWNFFANWTVVRVILCDWNQCCGCLLTFKYNVPHLTGPDCRQEDETEYENVTDFHHHYPTVALCLLVGWIVQTEKCYI